MRAGARQEAMQRGGAILSGVGVVSILCACTSVSVHGARPSSFQRIGTLKLAPVDGEFASVVLSQGVGLAPSRSGVTIGYSRETTISFSSLNDCRVVIVTDKSTDLTALRDILRDLNQTGGKTCAFTKDGKVVAP